MFVGSVVCPQGVPFEGSEEASRGREPPGRVVGTGRDYSGVPVGGPDPLLSEGTELSRGVWGRTRRGGPAVQDVRSHPSWTVVGWVLGSLWLGPETSSTPNHMGSPREKGRRVLGETSLPSLSQ